MGIRIRRLAAVLSAFLCLSMGEDPGQVCAQSEIDRIKALHVYNFLLFVDWPTNITQDRQCMRIGIMGDSKLFGLLRAMDQKKMRGKDLFISQMDDNGASLRSLQALFIGASLRHEAPRILAEVRNQPVLTISDMKGFAEMGGMVVLTYLHRGPDEQAASNRFRVNLKAVEGAGLKIRSQLLRLSDIVYSPQINQPDNP